MRIATIRARSGRGVTLIELMTALMITAILAMGYQVLCIAGCLVLVSMRQQRGAGLPMMFRGGMSAGFAVVELVLGAVVLIGAMKMKKLESYAFAMVAAILAMVPCFWPCCVLGLPFGIWALVVLSDGSVKAAFRS